MLQLKLNIILNDKLIQFFFIIKTNKLKKNAILIILGYFAIIHVFSIKKKKYILLRPDP